ncbi:MAG: PilZ domain-containing protein [Acidobacteria bacterium]|nr:PilZ domain-containing protein [Acidobacteriota bacterium]
MTVLIGSSKHLRALQAHNDFGETIAFATTDATHALSVIRSRRPDLVVIDREFAATARGVALVRRIKADDGLSACEVRIIALDGSFEDARGSQPGVNDARHRQAAGAARAARVPAEPPLAASPSGLRERRAPRFTIVEGVQVQIDGKAASLVDLSTVGAEVSSAIPLKPNQRVKFTLVDEAHPLHCRSVVVWASFDMPSGVPLYRAGLEFFDVNEAWLVGFIDAFKLHPREWK